MEAFDENEDPEDRLDRLYHARRNPRLMRLAIRSGKVAACSFGIAFLSFCGVGLLVSHGSSLAGAVFLVLMVFCGVVIGPVATLIDMCLVLVLARRGEKDLDTPVVLAVPGILLSLLVMAAFFA